MPKKARRFVTSPEFQASQNVIPTYELGGYVRLSVDQHDKKTDSIENQKDVIRQFVLRNNESPDRKMVFSEPKFYEDKGMSGTNFDRLGFEHLMDDIKKGKINCVICKDFSRFGRDFLDSVKYIEQILPMYQVRFISISDHFDSMGDDADTRRFEMRLKNLINDMYAKDISKKISDSKRISQLKGSFVGSRCPYGYKAEWQNRVRVLIPDEEAAEIVKYIFRTYYKGMTIRDIQQELFDKKVLRPKEYLQTGHVYQQEGDPLFLWRRMTIMDMLRNIVYSGSMAQGKSEQRLYEDRKDREFIPEKEWIVKHDTHEALIPVEIFQEVSDRVNRGKNQKIVKSAKERGKKERKNAKYENIFSDVMYCGDCQKKLGATFYQGRIEDIRKYRYYCRRYYLKDSRKCIKKSITEEKLIEILRLIVRETLKECHIKEKDLVKKNQEAATEILESFRAELAELNKREGECEGKIEDAYFQFKGKDIEVGDYYTVQRKMTVCIEKYNDQKKEIMRKMSQVKREVERQNKFLRSLLKASGREKFDKLLVNELVDSIYLYSDERICINLKFKGGDLYAGR